MRGLFTLFAAYVATASAHWSTHYAFEAGLIYLQLKNDDLVALNFSMAGFDSLSGSSLDLVNIQQNQLIRLLTAPPQNSSVFVYNNDLYAFNGEVQDSLAEYDPCGHGFLQLYRYNATSDAWVTAFNNMTFTDVDDMSYYLDSTYLTSTSSSQIYMYGGTCSSTGDISSRLLSLDMSTMTFSNISTSTKPQGFYGGTSVWAPSPLQLFVVGGRAQQGWLNMYQLATWSFQSGWLFQNIGQNGSHTISSRTNALALPVFAPLSDNTAQTFNRDYSPSSVLVMGGDSADANGSQWANLSFSGNQWNWQALDTNLDSSQIMGAAMIFDTLVVVNSTSGLTGNQARSGGTYHLNLYSVRNGFSMVGDLKSNTISAKGLGEKVAGISKTTKVLVGTLVPVAALSILFGTIMYLWRRQVTKKEEPKMAEPLDYDYQLGHFRTRLDHQYSLLGSRPLDLYQNINDSASTLEVASIDSWVRKRQEWDASRHKPALRHSYLASNETLNTHPESVNDEEKLEILGGLLVHTPILAAQKSHEDEHCEPSHDITDDAVVMPMIQSPSVNYGTPEGSPKKAALPVRLAQLRGFLYTQTPPQLPTIQRKSLLDPGFVTLGEGLDLGAHSDSDGESPDENMDVQVLVSSKRKSVLRVMNPDTEGGSGEGIRLRNPSK